jgi:choline-sulfatase/uncharacterized sulfatase
MVLADQHNADLLGCAGHSQALTPHIDAFAASGVRCTRAYTQNTICTPSRTCILSGQYCHNHGVYGLSGPAPGATNLFRHFKAHGYFTAGFGKLHLPNSPRAWIADDVDRFGDTYEDPDGTIGESDFLRYLEQRGVRELEDSWHNPDHYGPGMISHDSRPSDLPYVHTQEMWSARGATAAMDAAAAADQPFCVQVAFQRPHHPLLPNQRFWDLYPDDLALPPTINQDPSHRSPAFQRTWQAFRDRHWDYTELGPTWEDGARRAWRGTLACVSQVDDVFGHLLAHLTETGLADNTIVIYGSDHGGYHGIHGIEEKAPGISSEAVCRVPQIWRVPGFTPDGARCDALIENIDMAPTLAALCGLEPMDTADGADIRPLLAGDETPVREVAVTENAWSKALRWQHWRFVHHQPETWPDDDTEVGELYDLAADPDETRNLYHDPAHQPVVERCRRLLLEWLIRTTRVTTTQPALIEDAAGRRRRGHGVFGHFTYPVASDHRAPNDCQPRNNADVRNPNYI